MLNRIKALRITAAYKEAKEKALTGSTQSRNGTYEALETTHLANRRAGWTIVQKMDKEKHS